MISIPLNSVLEINIFFNMRFKNHCLSPCQHYFAWCKNQEDYFWILHFVYQTWKQLRLVMTPCKLLVFFLKSFKFNAKSYISTSDNILNFEFWELGLLCFIFTFANFLNCLFKDSGCLESFLFRFGTSYDNFTSPEDQCSSSRLSYSHYYGIEPLRIILCIATPLC